MQNQNVTMKFSIHQATANGTIVYEETQGTSTNDYGLINLQIGQGAPTIGTFSLIQWGQNTFFLQVQVDIGANYVNLGTTQFVSVPYAMVANTVLNGGGGDNWGTQKVVPKFPLAGGGVSGDSLNITPGQNTQVLYTNSLGKVVWKNSSFINGCMSMGSIVPTSWAALDFSTYCNVGTAGSVNLFLRIYSATSRTVYLRPPGCNTPECSVIVDISAGRTVLVLVSTLNGQIEWYSSDSSLIYFALMGIGRD